MNLKGAIIGVGKLGSLRLRVLKELPEVSKIYLVDIDTSKLKNYKEEIFYDYRNLKGIIDFAIVSVPTSHHFKIAKFFLENKIPVLVEKPLTSTLEEANTLINISRKNKTLLFVGHTERYNEAYLLAKRFIKKPKFIECHRLNPYPYRSLDISVVLDLMIHDLDILFDLVKDKVKRIFAVGIKVLSSYEDIANARIEFKNGCIANITSSRISKEKMRKLRIFSSTLYVSLDFIEKKVEIYKKVKNRIVKNVLSSKDEEPIKRETKDFLHLVKKRKIDYKSCQKAKKALEFALRIERIIRK